MTTIGKDLVIQSGYKQSDVAVIPLDWNTVKLGALTKLIIDGTHHTPKYKPFGVPFLRVTDIQGELDDRKFKFVSKEEHDLLIKRCNPEKGDLLLSKNGTIGVPKVINWDWNFSIFVSLALIKPRHDLLFVQYLEQFFKSNFLDRQLAQRAKQGTVTNLHLEEIRELLIPLPPTLAEQTAIANALSDVDTLISELEKLIAKKQAIKTATMQQLLTGKKRLPHFAKNEDGTEKGYKNSELGEIPEDWDVIALGAASTFINGRAYALDEWEKHGIPVIRLQNLTGRGEQYYYSNLQLPEKQYCNFGDLLFMWSATFGPVIWRGTKAIYHYHIWKIVCGSGYSKSYLFYLLSDMTEKLKRGSSSGGTMLHVTKEKMETTEAIFPPLEEQVAIASILSDMDSDIQALEQRLSKTRQIKQGMMQELLTGKTRLVKPETK